MELFKWEDKEEKGIVTHLAVNLFLGQLQVALHSVSSATGKLLAVRGTEDLGNTELNQLLEGLVTSSALGKGTVWVVSECALNSMIVENGNNIFCV